MTSLDRYSDRLDLSVVGARRRTLSERYPAIADSVPRARRKIVAFAAGAGADVDQIESVRLAVSEALSNVVQHAYPGSPGKIDVTAWVVEDELWILIADDGSGLHAGRESEGLGLGLALIAQISDGFVVMERASGGTEVRMRFELDIAGDDSPSRVRFLR
ncbi:MAG TPA: ATP-binding protein [Solirubrobacteraceae bacterium]|jgi:anti-sigma regulatory factor (Ser/Thr protein kinase)